ncbi:GyrI-like domain-containing protein [Nonomuraea salmonea]|uniref:GyrI-like domain-containing protein n=1 Tax=Nonomuraea salmonea TaxID=46181 RepID=UPI002FEB0F1F
MLAGSAGALEGVRRTLEEELARRRRTLGVLERVMAEGLPETAVRVVEEEPLRVLLVRERAAGMEDVGRATSAAVARLLAGPAMAGPVRLVGLFPLDVAEAMEVAVGLAVDESQGGAVVLPGGRFACATHVGGLRADVADRARAAGVVRRAGGRRCGGPVREVYVSDPAVTAPGELVTEVLVRLDDPARE